MGARFWHVNPSITASKSSEGSIRLHCGHVNPSRTACKPQYNKSCCSSRSAGFEFRWIRNQLIPIHLDSNSAGFEFHQLRIHLYSNLAEFKFSWIRIHLDWNSAGFDFTWIQIQLDSNSDPSDPQSEPKVSQSGSQVAPKCSKVLNWLH